MKLRTNFALVTCALTLIFVGCSSYDNHTKQIENNIARFVAPKPITSNDPRGRKKPIKPTPEHEIFSGAAGFAARDKSDSSIMYRVLQGDTIYGIARKFGVKPKEIMTTNGLDRNSILHVGQKLKIEKCANAELVHIVMAEDTLSTIANKYKTSAEAIKDKNKLQSNVLSAGQKLLIPSAEMQKKPAVEISSSKPLEQKRYSVQSGDSLYAIARKFGISQHELQKVNNISDPSRLYIGQTLVIPGETLSKSTPEQVQNFTAPESSANRELHRKNAENMQEQGKQIPEQKNQISTTGTSEDDDFFSNFDQIPIIEIMSN